MKAIQLDVTGPASVTAPAEVTHDVTVLINNAGSSTGSDLLTGSWDAIRLEVETHSLGTLCMIRAFGPLIEAQGGGCRYIIRAGRAAY
ncbi:hypothetical protein ACWGCW_30350 [Streptomyces sp. NPDC054933]